MADKGYTATTPRLTEVKATVLSKSEVYESNILAPGTHSTPLMVITSNEREMTRISSLAVCAALNKAAGL